MVSGCERRRSARVARVTAGAGPVERCRRAMERRRGRLCMAGGAVEALERLRAAVTGIACERVRPALDRKEPVVFGRGDRVDPRRNRAWFALRTGKEAERDAAEPEAMHLLGPPMVSMRELRPGAPPHRETARHLVSAKEPSTLH